MDYKKEIAKIKKSKDNQDFILRFKRITTKYLEDNSLEDTIKLGSVLAYTYALNTLQDFYKAQRTLEKDRVNTTVARLTSNLVHTALSVDVQGNPVLQDSDKLYAKLVEVTEKDKERYLAKSLKVRELSERDLEKAKKAFDKYVIDSETNTKISGNTIQFDSTSGTWLISTETSPTIAAIVITMGRGRVISYVLRGEVSTQVTPVSGTENTVPLKELKTELRKIVKLSKSTEVKEFIYYLLPQL